MLNRKAAWVQFRNSRLTLTQRQAMLRTEFGGIGETLSNLYQYGENAAHLTTAQYFDHAQIFDPLANNSDQLNGFHANTQIPKALGAIREYHATGTTRYRDIASNFWNFVVNQHSYAIGGNSNGEYFQPPNAHRQRAVGLHLRVLQLVQHAQADPAAVLHVPEPGRRAHGLLREGALQPPARRAEPELVARLPLLLRAAAGRRHQDLQQRLQQLHLLPRHRHGDQHEVRRQHLLLQRQHAVGEPVHRVHADLARARHHASGRTPPIPRRRPAGSPSPAPGPSTCGCASRPGPRARRCGSTARCRAARPRAPI